MEKWREDLYHHGIRGQKWGVRNGPPYPLRPGAHSKSEEKAGWRKSLNKLKDKKKEADARQLRDLNTMSPKEYKKRYQSSQEKDKKKLEKYGSLSRWDTLTDKQKKAIIAAGLITVGALSVAYAYNKYGGLGKNYIDDVIIKSGMTLQTLSGDPDRIKLGEHFYTAYLDSDKRTYLANFSNLNKNELKSKILTNVIDDIKVASPATVRKELEEFTRKLAKSEDGMNTLRKFKESQISDMMIDPFRRPMQMFDKDNKDLVEANVNLMLGPDFGWNTFTYDYIRNLNFMYEGSDLYDERAMPYVRGFYEHLKNKGYSALKDSNDMGWTNIPTIVFDRTKIGESVVNEITKKEVTVAMAKEFLKDAFTPSDIEDLINMGGTSAAAVTSLGILGTAEYNVRKKNSQQNGG